MGELSNHNLPVGTEKGSLLPKKSCFLLLKPGSVFQSYVLYKGNWESFAQIYLSDMVRGWGLLLELTAQPPVIPWTGTATGWVPWSPGGLIRDLRDPPDWSTSRAACGPFPGLKEVAR